MSFGNQLFDQTMENSFAEYRLQFEKLLRPYAEKSLFMCRISLSEVAKFLECHDFEYIQLCLITQGIELVLCSGMHPHLGNGNQEEYYRFEWNNKISGLGLELYNIALNFLKEKFNQLFEPYITRCMFECRITQRELEDSFINVDNALEWIKTQDVSVAQVGKKSDNIYKFEWFSAIDKLPGIYGNHMKEKLRKKSVSNKEPQRVLDKAANTQNMNANSTEGTEHSTNQVYN